MFQRTKIWHLPNAHFGRSGEGLQSESRDNEVYPDPNVPRHGKSLYKPYSSWVFMGKLSPRIPREHNKYQGYTVRGTPHCPLSESSLCWIRSVWLTAFSHDKDHACKTRPSCSFTMLSICSGICWLCCSFALSKFFGSIYQSFQLWGIFHTRTFGL